MLSAIKKRNVSVKLDAKFTDRCAEKEMDGVIVYFLIVLQIGQTSTLELAWM